MKKTLALLTILVIVAGCNKGNQYRSDIKGTWQVYKYTLRGGDKSGDYKNYNLFFGDNGKYAELFATTDTSYPVHTGAYDFEDNGNKLVLIDTTVVMVDTAWVTQVQKRKYSVFNLTYVHVQLRNDTSELYMQKLK